MHRQAVGTHPLWKGAVVPRPVDLDVTVTAMPQHLPLLRQTAHSFAARRGVPRPDDVRLAVGEACMDVVRYAYPGGRPGPMRLHGTSDGRFVTFTVEDRGCGLQPHPFDHGLGIGLPIVARAADHFSIEDNDGRGTRVRMAFAISPGRSS